MIATVSGQLRYWDVELVLLAGGVLIAVGHNVDKIKGALERARTRKLEDDRRAP